jgi:hypothetical protein
LHAIKVHYDDGGYSGPFGTPNEHQLDIKWNAGDPIDEILTWGNKKKDAVGRLALTVAKNETVFDTDVYNEEDPQPQTIHSGILLGVRGLVNDRIRTLEFKFMTSKAAKVSIVELKFPGGLENYINTHKE